MEKKNKVCWNCGKFKAYYEKGFSRFYKTDVGVCVLKKEIVEKHGECEGWCNRYKMRRLRKKCVIRTLNEIVVDIAAIRQIFEEEDEENRLDPLPKEKDSCNEESEW